MVWLDPFPLTGEIPKLYKNYHTHSLNEATPRSQHHGFKEGTLKAALLVQAFGYENLQPSGRLDLLYKILAKNPLSKDQVGSKVMWLDKNRRGRLLDVGCGSGRFLSRMAGLGWKVSGYEPDPVAAAVAREQYGLNVTSGSFEKQAFDSGSFDAITMSHVVEHLEDPVGVLRACAAMLKCEGRIVVLTPNVESLGHRSFGINWRGLEPPRHLFLFNPRSLRYTAETAGLEIERLWTPAYAATSLWVKSRILGRTRDAVPSLDYYEGKLVEYLKIEGAAFSFIENLLARILPWGEYLVMIAKKQ